MRNEWLGPLLAMAFALVLAATVLGAHLMLDKPFRAIQADHTNALQFQLEQQEQTIMALADSIEIVRASCVEKCNLLRCVP